jgi:putative flippase GtrA
VTLVRGLYTRFRQLIHEAAKFGVVGIIGVFITNGCYSLLHNGYGVGPVTSTTVATIVATAFSYVANRYWSFRHRERTGVARETLIFFVLNGVGLLIQDAVVGFNYYILGNQEDKLAGFIALNLGIAVATLFRFWSYRRWVWAPRPDGGASVVGQPGPAGSPLPQLVVWDQASADGQAPDLLHAKGHASGHTHCEHASRTGTPSRDR